MTNDKTRQTEISGIAVAAITAGVLGFVTDGFSSPFAILLGIAAIPHILFGRKKRRGWLLAIAGIFLGIVILIPALRASRVMAIRMGCGSNLAYIREAFTDYVKDSNGTDYPDPEHWCDQLIQRGYITEAQLSCPGGGDGRCHYAMNPNARPDADPNVVLLFDAIEGWNQKGGAELLTADNHYSHGAHIMLSDGTL